MREKLYNRNTTEMMPLPFKTKKANVKVSFSFYHGLSLQPLPKLKSYQLSQLLCIKIKNNDTNPASFVSPKKKKKGT